MTWTVDSIATLTKLWRKGVACKEIACRLNETYGTKFSTSAVIGKADRLNLPTHASSIKKTEAQRINNERRLARQQKSYGQSRGIY